MVDTKTNVDLSCDKEAAWIMHWVEVPEDDYGRPLRLEGVYPRNMTVAWTGELHMNSHKTKRMVYTSVQKVETLIAIAYWAIRKLRLHVETKTRHDQILARKVELAQTAEVQEYEAIERELNSIYAGGFTG
jgi:hypothetical protein